MEKHIKIYTLWYVPSQLLAYAPICQDIHVPSSSFCIPPLDTPQSNYRKRDDVLWPNWGGGNSKPQQPG